MRTTPGGRLSYRVIADVVEIGVVDRAMTLSAQAFTSLVPVMMALGTSGALKSVSEALRSDYGIDLSGLEATGDLSSGAFGVVGILMLLVSATSYARALGRTYGRIWNVAVIAFVQGWRWILVIVAVASGAVAIGAARALDDVPTMGPLLVVSVQFAVWLLVWTAIPILLIPSGLSPRARWATGVLTAFGLTALQIGSNVGLARIIDSAQEQFGVLGMVFTLIGWLFVYSAIVVVAAVIVHAVSEDEYSLGTWLRNSDR